MNIFASKAPQYRVVQEIPGTDDPTYAGPAHDLETALRVFAGVLDSCPEGFFGPHTKNRMKVVPAEVSR